MIVSASILLFSGILLTQDKPKKEAKMEGDYVKADSTKNMKHTAKMMKKTAQKID